MDLILYGVPAAGLIVALVEVVKHTVHLDTRWAPLLALGLGVVLAVLLRLEDPTVGTWLQTVLMGLMAGLSAAGFYSGGKAVAGR